MDLFLVTVQHYVVYHLYKQLERSGYGKQKIKKLKKGLVGLFAAACDVEGKVLLSYYLMRHQNAPHVLTFLD